MNMNLNIHFEDLPEDFKKRILEHFGVENPDKINWKKMPINMIYNVTIPTDFADITHLFPTKFTVNYC